MSANKTFTHRVPIGRSWLNNNFGTITTGVVNQTSIFTDSVVYGANDPKWRAKIREGIGVITPLTGIKCSINPSYGFCKSSQGSAYQEVSGYLLNQSNRDPETISTSGLDMAAALAECKTKSAIAFAKSYRKKTRQWQSGVFALELFKTAAMIASPAKTLRKATDQLADRASKTARKALAGRTLASVKRMPHGPQKSRIVATYKRAMSDTYLEWVFGVTPTFNDAIDAATAFRAMASGRTFDTVRCFGESRAARSGPDVSAIFAPNAGFGSHSAYKESSRAKYEVYHRYIGAWKNQNPSALMPLPKTFGLSALDILPTTLEIIPWSFLVEYFINIGEVLDAWQMRFVTFSWCVENTLENLSQVVTPPPPSFNSGGASPRIIVCSATPTVLYKRTATRRAVTTAFETDFMVKIPGIASKQGLNIAALVAGLTNKGFIPPSRS